MDEMEALRARLTTYRTGTQPDLITCDGEYLDEVLTELLRLRVAMAPKPLHDTGECSNTCPACAWDEAHPRVADVVDLIDTSIQFAPKPCREAMLAARTLLTEGR